MFVQKYYISTAFVNVGYLYMSENSIVFKDVILYFLWYNVIHSSNHICKTSSLLSFYSFLVKFRE